LKLSGTHQPLVYADDIYILGESVHTMKENEEDLVVASKEIRLEVNADKTKYMVMSRDQNAEQNNNNNNKYFETVEQFKYLGTNLTDQNSLQEEIRAD
jgi:hypothetical protein